MDGKKKVKILAIMMAIMMTVSNVQASPEIWENESQIKQKIGRVATDTNLSDYIIADLGRGEGNFSRLQAVETSTENIFKAYCVDPDIDFNRYYPAYNSTDLEINNFNAIKNMLNWSGAVQSREALEALHGLVLTDADAHDATVLAIWYYITNGQYPYTPDLLSISGNKLYNKLINLPENIKLPSATLQLEENEWRFFEGRREFGPFRINFESTGDTDIDRFYLDEMIKFIKGDEDTDYIVKEHDSHITYTDKVPYDRILALEYGEFDELRAFPILQTPFDNLNQITDFEVIESILGATLGQTIGVVKIARVDNNLAQSMQIERLLDEDNVLLSVFKKGDMGGKVAIYFLAEDVWMRWNYDDLYITPGNGGVAHKNTIMELPRYMTYMLVEELPEFTAETRLDTGLQYTNDVGQQIYYGNNRNINTHIIESVCEICGSTYVKTSKYCDIINYMHSDDPYGVSYFEIGLDDFDGLSEWDRQAMATQVDSDGFPTEGSSKLRTASLVFDSWDKTTIDLQLHNEQIISDIVNTEEHVCPQSVSPWHSAVKQTITLQKIFKSNISGVSPNKAHKFLVFRQYGSYYQYADTITITTTRDSVPVAEQYLSLLGDEVGIGYTSLVFVELNDNSIGDAVRIPNNIIPELSYIKQQIVQTDVGINKSPKVGDKDYYINLADDSILTDDVVSINKILAILNGDNSVGELVESSANKGNVTGYPVAWIYLDGPTTDSFDYSVEFVNREQTILHSPEIEEGKGVAKIVKHGYDDLEDITPTVLNGAVFDIYDSTGQNIVYADWTLNNAYKIAVYDGYTGYVTPALPNGIYILKEKQAPTGYVLQNDDSGLNEVAIVVNGLPTSISPVWEIKNYKKNLLNKDIVIEKVDSDGNALKGAVFELWNVTDGEALKTKIGTVDLTTNNRATLNLPYGKYRLIETTLPKDVQVPVTHEFEVTVLTTDNTVITVKNHQIGTINLHKHDRKNVLSHLGGAEFKITGVTDLTFTKNITTTEGLADIIANLPYGIYQIQETKPPTGFTLNDYKYTFVVDDTVKSFHIFNDNEGFEIPEGQISVQKKMEDYKGDLINTGPATFEVYQVIGGGPDLLVDTIITDDNGYGISSSLATGEYKLKETSAPDGTVLNLNTLNGIMVTADNITHTDFVNKQESVHDLALQKWVSKYDGTNTGYNGTTQTEIPTEISENKVIEYSLRIINQGNTNGYPDKIVDYLDMDSNKLIFNPELNSRYWSEKDGYVYYDYTGALADGVYGSKVLSPNESTAITLYLTVDGSLDYGTIVRNYAEIVNMWGFEEGRFLAVSDIDSFNNDNPNDDKVAGDNYVQNEQEDIDAHDYADIIVYINKTEKETEPTTVDLTTEDRQETTEGEEIAETTTETTTKQGTSSDDQTQYAAENKEAVQLTTLAETTTEDNLETTTELVIEEPTTRLLEYTSETTTEHISEYSSTNNNRGETNGTVEPTENYEHVDDDAVPEGYIRVQRIDEYGNIYYELVPVSSLSRDKNGRDSNPVIKSNPMTYDYTNPIDLLVIYSILPLLLAVRKLKNKVMKEYVQ